MKDNNDENSRELRLERGTYTQRELLEREDAIREAYNYFLSLLGSEHTVKKTVPHISSDTESVGTITTRTCMVKGSDEKWYELVETSQTDKEPELKLVHKTSDESSGQTSKVEFVFRNGAVAKNATRVQIVTTPSGVLPPEESRLQKDEIDALVFSLLEPTYKSPEQEVPIKNRRARLFGDNVFRIFKK